MDTIEMLKQGALNKTSFIRKEVERMCCYYHIEKLDQVRKLLLEIQEDLITPIRDNIMEKEEGL